MSEPEPPPVSPQQFASLVRQASDEQLAEGLAANRELILGEIFRRMPDSLDAERARSVDAVVEWEVLGDGGAPSDRWRVEIRGGRCTVEPGGAGDADVRYRIGALDFLKLVAGVADGPRLFMFGRLRIRGNLMLAARMPALFRIPGGREPAPPPG